MAHLLSRFSQCTNGSKWIYGLYEGSSPPKPHAPLALAAAAVSPNLVTGSNLLTCISLLRLSVSLHYGPQGQSLLPWFERPKPPRKPSSYQP